MYEYVGIYNTPMAFLPITTTTCPIQQLAKNESVMSGVSECLFDVVDFYASRLLCGPSPVLAPILAILQEDLTTLWEPCSFSALGIQTPKAHEKLGDTSEELATAFQLYVIESLARPAPEAVIDRSIELLKAQHEQAAVGTLASLQQEQAEIEVRQRSQSKTLIQAINARRKDRINYLEAVIRHETAAMFRTSGEPSALRISLRIARDRLAARVSDGGWENIKGTSPLGASGSATLYNNTTREYGERPTGVAYSWYLDTAASLLYLG